VYTDLFFSFTYSWNKYKNLRTNIIKQNYHQKYLMTSFKILLNRKEFLYVRIINNFVVLKSLKDEFKRYPVLDLSNIPPCILYYRVSQKKHRNSVTNSILSFQIILWFSIVIPTEKAVFVCCLQFVCLCFNCIQFISLNYSLKTCSLLLH